VDSERPVAPLKPADDAVIIDTDHLELEEVVDRILKEVSARA
jgi:cytidylate kinase